MIHPGRPEYFFECTLYHAELLGEPLAIVHRLEDRVLNQCICQWVVSHVSSMTSDTIGGAGRVG